VLLGDQERLPDAPYKLKLTYEAVTHWELFSHSSWLPRRDGTIGRQAEAFDRLYYGKKANFKPEQAEDFCFAHAFCGLSAEEGERRWPSLRGHESDRIHEMETQAYVARSGGVVTSRDHRVVQALAMWCVANHELPLFAHPGAVSKSWPQFWDFLKQYQ
jgi:hypothetical protein